MCVVIGGEVYTGGCGGVIFILSAKATTAAQWMNEWMTEQKDIWRRMELERNLWLLKHNNNKIDKRKVCVDKENLKYL